MKRTPATAPLPSGEAHDQQHPQWRMLSPLKFADTVLHLGDEDIHLFKVPPGAMTAVYLGVRSSQALEQRLRDLITSQPDLSHVLMYRARRDERTQRIVFDEYLGNSASQLLWGVRSHQSRNRLL